MILAIVPLASVPTLASVKDQDAILVGFAHLKVTKVDLFNHRHIFLIEHCDKASASRFVVHFASVEVRAISQFANSLGTVTDEGNHSLNSLIISLLSNAIEIEVV